MLRTSSETLAWIRLSLLRTLSPVDLLGLLQRFEAPEAVFDASYGTLIRYAGDAAAAEIRSSELETRAKEIVAQIEVSDGVGVLCWTDPEYPSLMVSAGSAPPVLYYRGRIECLSRPILTVAGTTHPDPEEQENAAAFGRSLGREPVTCSTGLYPGVEAAFMKGLMEHHPVSALIWSATGPDRIWPADQRELLLDILKNGGLLLSASAPGSRVSEAERVLQTHCRMASANALLVVAASRTSESLRLAALAADWGRDVMAVPGSINAHFSKGCHKLIREGAKLVESGNDVMTELRTRA